MEKGLYCVSLLNKINDLTLLKIKLDERLEQTEDDIVVLRDTQIYKDVSSDLKYKHVLYMKNCSSYKEYFLNLWK